MPRRRRILLSLCVALALLGGWIGWFRYREAQSRIFDATTWRQTRSSDYVRGRMVPDLLAHHRLEGMTRAQVVALLGEPTQLRDGAFVYDLGYPDDDLFPIDPYLLVIDFDGRGIAMRHAVVQG